jgi:5-bromo-4-chloroindolyl phosphate hydrolysis protein
MARPTSGLNWIAGGAVAAILLPALAIGIGLPFWLVLVAGAVAGGGVAMALTPPKPFEQLEASGVARAKIELARELLDDAEPMLRRLEEAIKTIRNAGTRDRARHLANIGHDILGAIKEDPLRIDRVRRFLTYYLPRAAEMAEAYARLERSAAPDLARLAATGGLIERLDTAFTQYAANLQSGDLDKLDIELKLLKSSLDDDLGPQNPQASPTDAASKRSA